MGIGNSYKKLSRNGKAVTDESERESRAGVPRPAETQWVHVLKGEGGRKAMMMMIQEILAVKSLS